jgi:hypothetical protein
MNKKIVFRLAQISILIFVVILIQKCGGDSSVNETGDSMSGTVTYISSVFYPQYGYYAISIFGDSANPYTHTPVRSDTIHVITGTSSYYWKMYGVPPGYYYIGTTYRTSSGFEVQGGYGCDTTKHCTNPTRIAFPSNAGAGSLNFLSFADPNYYIYP